MQKQIITLLCAAGLAISAPAFSASKSSKLKIKPNAPTRYVVKQGDTLWSISGKYLYRPYKWAQLWNVNKGKIRNPHLIYPGQVLNLRWVNGRPVLSAGNGAGSVDGIPRVKLRPGMRDLGSGYGIPTLNVDFYRMFMKHPQFMSNEQLKAAPRIVAGPETRVLYNTGDRIYADGPVDEGRYLVFRTVRNLKDPKTGKELGNLVEFAGEAYTIATNDTAYHNREDQIPTLSDGQRHFRQEDEYYVKSGKKMVQVRSATPMLVGDMVSEIRQGDYLVRKDEVMPPFNIMPHEPDAPMTANIINVMDGVSQAGFGQTLILNKGEADGLNPGTVLSIYKNGRTVKSQWQSPTEKAAQYVNIPAKEIGLAMVYRTGANVSSAIILESTSEVNIQDTLREPGRDVDTFTEVPPKESLIADDTTFEPLTSDSLLPKVLEKFEKPKRSE